MARARKKKAEAVEYVSPIKAYYEQILDGKITVCREIRAVYKHLYHKLDNSDDGFHYEPERGKRVIDFIEMFCTLPSTKAKAKLLLFQRAMLDAIFSFVDDEGNRQYRECLYLIGRKNGKTVLAACIGLYLLVADKEEEPQILCCANTKDQARLLWNSASDVLRKSADLKQVLKGRVNDIICKTNGGYFKPLASDKDSLDGYAGHGVFLDEIHEYKNTELYSLMRDSSEARNQPLLLLTSTQGFLRNCFIDYKLDEYLKIIEDMEKGEKVDARRLPIIYKLDSEAEYTDSSMWIKANPSIGIVRKMESLSEEVERAKTDIVVRKNILCKFFNLPQNGVSRFLSFEEISNDNTWDMEQFRDSYYIGGWDLSLINDLTSACMIFKKPNEDTLYVKSMCWIPPAMLETNLKTGIPYDIWIEKDWIRLSSNEKEICVDDVREWFVEMCDRYEVIPYKIGYDPWGSKPLIEQMKKHYGDNTCQVVRQGAKTLNFPLQYMKESFRGQRINYDNNQCLKWCLSNLQVVQDSNANLNTVKNRNDKMQKDDGAIALLNALAVYYSEMENFNNLIEE